MDIASIISFLLASVALTIMPGPDNIYVLSESITRGARTGILISIGLISGILVHTALAATGISIIIQQSDLLFQVIKYIGAIYLFYLAYQASRETQVNISTPEYENFNGSMDGFKLIRQGFFMNVLNPKVSLFFLALLPQFITPDGWKIPTQMIGLGLIFMIQGIIIFVLISIAAGRLSRLVAQSAFWDIMKWIKVGVLAVLGISLLLA